MAPYQMGPSPLGGIPPYNPYHPQPYYYTPDGKIKQDKYFKSMQKHAMNPFGKGNAKFDFSTKGLKHFYDGGMHTGIHGPPHFNEVPASSGSGVQVNGIPMNASEADADNNDFFTGRDFVSLDWGLDFADRDPDQDSEDEDADEDIDSESGGSLAD